ncbi:MAG: HAMP domain-containing histidine kinase [Acidimicrobiia bacterium]|nr:HAMP domain-containing histidine kinase [Acidimicrobiia bacterium]
MSLRSRIAVLVAAAVAIVTLVTAGAVSVLSGRELRGQVDEFLEVRAELIAPAAELVDRSVQNRRGFGLDPVNGILFAADTIVQVVNEDGRVIGLVDAEVVLEVTDADYAVAAGGRRVLRTVDVDGTPYRMITEPANRGLAVQVARDLTETEAVLGDLRRRLILIGAIGVAAAAGVGWLIARSAVEPVTKLTATARRVAETQDLEAKIDVDRTDEIGSLAASFNEMLDALGESRAQQHRLVMDASHELRTPLTSLRTNIELLDRVPDMGEEDRERLLEDVGLELGELTALVEELVDTATAARSAEPAMEVQLDDIARRVAERAIRRHGVEVMVDAEGSPVMAPPMLLERAAWNLVDNAAKWTSNGAPIEVTVTGGRFTVRDHGPGFDEEDIPHVFDRFYRASAARSRPGSGLGLAIVKYVVDSLDGEVFARNAEGGGAEVGFEIPRFSSDS